MARCLFVVEEAASFYTTEHLEFTFFSWWDTASALCFRCVSKTLLLPCGSAAVMAETLPLPCVSAACVSKTLPSPCVSTAV